MAKSTNEGLLKIAKNVVETNKYDFKKTRRIATTCVKPRVAAGMMPSMSPLPALLAVLRAAAIIHQTHHWQTNGHVYYADHLLFQRLYEESVGFVDQVAERAVGLEDSSVVDASTQVAAVGNLVSTLCNGSLDPDEMVQISLDTESLVIQAVDMTIESLKSANQLTNGTDNLLQGIADLHETFIYLLRQRSA